MITSSLGTFFWIMSLYLYIFKYKMQLSKYYDLVFFSLVVLFLYFINVEIMKERCGIYTAIILPTIIPWLCIFLPFMMLLQYFPEWKTPFSNTFGYLIVYLTGGVRTIEKVLVSQDKLALIYQSPSLLINQFTYDGFETEAAENYSGMFQLSDVEAVNAFKNILLLKEIVSIWIWYMLIASITISTSYIMLMNSECTKTVDDYLLANKKSTERNK